RQPDREILAEAEHRHVKALDRVEDLPPGQVRMLCGQEPAHQCAGERDLGGWRSGMDKLLLARTRVCLRWCGHTSIITPRYDACARSRTGRGAGRCQMWTSTTIL